MYPYLDLAGFRRRTTMPSMEVDQLESIFPGYTAVRIAVQSSWMNSRFRKRHGKSLPFGQGAPTLLAYGTSPPVLTLTGRPTLGSYQPQVVITTAGVLGVSRLKWSMDGINFTTGVTTASTVVLGTTGLILTMPAETYSADNSYLAATPVPEVVLGWLTTLVTMDLYRRRGVDPQDPFVEMLAKDIDRVYAEVKEAADSKDGLFDIPTSEDQDSSVTTGGPLGYSEASPYVWTDQEAYVASAQDCQARSSGGGIIGSGD